MNINEVSSTLNSLQLNPNFKPAGAPSVSYTSPNPTPTEGVKTNGKGNGFGGKSKK